MGAISPDIKLVDVERRIKDNWLVFTCLVDDSFIGIVIKFKGQLLSKELTVIKAWKQCC